MNNVLNMKGKPDKRQRGILPIIEAGTTFLEELQKGTADKSGSSATIHGRFLKVHTKFQNAQPLFSQNAEKDLFQGVSTMDVFASTERKASSIQTNWDVLRAELSTLLPTIIHWTTHTLPAGYTAINDLAVSLDETVAQMSKMILEMNKALGAVNKDAMATQMKTTMDNAKSINKFLVIGQIPKNFAAQLREYFIVHPDAKVQPCPEYKATVSSVKL